MPHFVEVVLIQLPHEAGKVAVLEVFREDVLGELLVLRVVVVSGLSFVESVMTTQRAQRTSSTTKLSPSFPHRTMLSSWGFSNILFES